VAFPGVSFDNGGIIAPAAYQAGVIYVITNTDTAHATVFALNAADGFKLWRHPLSQLNWGGQPPQTPSQSAHDPSTAPPISLAAAHSVVPRLLLSKNTMGARGRYRNNAVPRTLTRTVDRSWLRRRHSQYDARPAAAVSVRTRFPRASSSLVRTSNETFSCQVFDAVQAQPALTATTGQTINALSSKAAKNLLGESLGTRELAETLVKSPDGLVSSAASNGHDQAIRKPEFGVPTVLFQRFGNHLRVLYTQVHIVQEGLDHSLNASVI
jgi:hypothetical protein